MSDNFIAMLDFVKWNSWLNPECDLGPYSGLAPAASRAVCIGINGAPSSVTVAMSSTASTSTAVRLTQAVAQSHTTSSTIRSRVVTAVPGQT